MDSPPERYQLKRKYNDDVLCCVRCGCAFRAQIHIMHTLTRT